MESRDTWLSTLSIVSAFLLLFATGPTADAIDPDSWDLVTVDFNRIRFFKNDINVRNSTMANISEISALAYDGANGILYMDDRGIHGNVLTSCNLNEEDLIARPIPLCSDQDPFYPDIYDMDFDPVTNTLFLLSDSKEAILKMNIASSGSCNRLERIDLRGMRLRGITLDICHKFIYWAYEAPGIKMKVEKARLDGTERKEIVGGTEWPWIHDMAVDNYAGKLYFVGGVQYDPLYTFTIEESNLDGTDKRVLVNGTGAIPIQLAVDDTAVYWIQLDSQEMWKMYKNGTANPVMKSYAWNIISRGNADCVMKAKSDGSSTLPGVDPILP